MNKLKILTAVSIGILTTYLLRDQFVGANWMYLFMILIAFHFLYSGFSIKGIKPVKILFVVAAMLGILIYGKGWSAFLLTVSYLALIADTKPNLTGYYSDLIYGITNSVKGLSQFFTVREEGLKGGSSSSAKFYYVVIPSLIVIVFTGFYSAGSSFMASFISDVFSEIGELFQRVFGVLDFQWFLLFFMGILLLSAAINKVDKGLFLQRLVNSPDLLLRKSRQFPNGVVRKKSSVFHKNMIALKIEYKLGCLVLASLNILLFMTNGLDVFNLWFNFNPEGVQLSQFVHEGTYVLIFSILLASLVLLFYYRGNINFLKENKFLYRMAQIWIVQNAVLATSVAIRNYHYINYTYALTEKRIGVFVFLVLVLIGLFLLYQKVTYKRSVSWLLKINFIVTMAVISVVQLVNWERVIISYNFSNPQKSQIDMEQVFREVDYDFVFLEECINESDGELLFNGYWAEYDAYKAWNSKKAAYYYQYDATKNKAWNYFKWNNLSRLEFYDSDYSGSEVYN